MGIFRNRALFVTMGSRYKDRASTIADWIKKDKERQEKQDNTPPPKIDCPECNSKMIAEDFRCLEDWPEDQPMRVLFFFDCPNCNHRLGAYNDGEIFSSKPELCPQCNKELVVKRVKEDKIITTTSTCSNCDYSKEETEDLEEKKIEHKKWEKQQQKEKQRDKELLKRFRSEFCLSDEKGKQYVETLEALKVAREVRKEVMAELDTPAHEKLLKIDRLSVSDLEIFLKKVLTDSGFARLTFDKPEVDRQVIIPFTLQETKPKRRD